MEETVLFYGRVLNQLETGVGSFIIALNSHGQVLAGISQIIDEIGNEQRQRILINLQGSIEQVYFPGFQVQEIA